MSKFTAIVLSAGKGRRMNSVIPKQYMNLYGMPVLVHSLKAFEKSDVDEIVIVCGTGDEEFVRTEIVEKYRIGKVTHIVEGGKERFNSVHNGLKACEGTDYVLIHDGARPFVSVEVINGNIRELEKYPALVTAVASTDTVKIVDDDGFVVSTPQRKNCYIIQTPQSFRYDIAREAYDMYGKESENGSDFFATDDAQVVETFMNIKVKVINGDYGNIKITNPSDLKD